MTDSPVAVVGPGAIGALLAAGFAKGGKRPLVVGRGKTWLRAMRRRGLRVEGGRFGRGFVLSSRNATPVLRPGRAPCSAVFFCVKAGDLPGALRTARPLMGEDTAAVSLLNGVGHILSFIRSVGRRRAVLGVAYLAGDRPEPLRVVHTGGSGFVLGRHPANKAALGRALKALRASGWEAESGPEEGRLLWTKTSFNAAVNPLGALTRRANGELVSIPALRELLFKAAAEGAAAARAAGHAPLYPDMAGTLDRGCRAAPLQVNSMLQDLRAGRPTEADSIILPLLKAARKKRVKTPILEGLYRFVKRLERELSPSLHAPGHKEARDRATRCSPYRTASPRGRRAI